MSFSDLVNVFYWWVILFSVGMIFLPLTHLLFHSFVDKGYIFTKILGLLLLGYTIWLLSSFKILPFTNWAIFIVLGVFLAINSYVSQKNNTFFKFKSILRLIIFEEGLFILGFIFWAWVRSFEPSVHGLEKFMDFGFMNSILRTDYFPPKDLWLTPLSINYYYFGHLITALLIKSSGVKPEVSYNLMVAALFGLTLTASFSIGANLYHFFTTSIKAVASRKWLITSGILSAFLVTLGGNLHTIYIFFQSYNVEKPVPFWQLPFMPNLSSYWYPNATRFIPFTIHEFPIYSFVVSDLHGHVLGIPFILLIIALLIKIFFSPKLPTLPSGRHALNYVLLSLLVGTALMTNVLDGPIYLLVIFIVLLTKNSLLNTVKITALTLLGVAVFSLPFWLSFKPFGSGVGVLCAPTFLTNIGKLGPFLFEANHCARSPLWMLLILWGFFLFVALGFIFHVLKFKFNLKLKFGQIKNPTDILVLALIITSAILILIPEFFYVKDIYPAHYRANTVFKFGYQAFIILGLVSGYIITQLITLRNSSKFYIVNFTLLIFLFFLVAIYPYLATRSYYGGLKNSVGLDGLQWLDKQYPSDYKAILWMRENIPGQPVILEAQGDSYTDYARVSSYTGLPTVVGWPVHEWLWRGSYDEAGKRSGEVTMMYESQDPLVTEQLLKKYNVKYVFVGILERQKYTKLNEVKFQNLGKVIFEEGQTKIYQLN